MLQPLGFSVEQERVYRAVMRLGHVDPAEFDAAVLDGLVARGLLKAVPGPPARYGLVPPDLAVESLLVRRQQELSTVLTAMVELSREYRSARGTSPTDMVEVVVGSAVSERSKRLQAGARVEVLAMATMPYVAEEPVPNEIETEQLGRGVGYRVIYDEAVVDQPNGLAHLRRYVDLGEQARVLPGVPTKLFVADRCTALVPLTEPYAVDASPCALQVHPSALLDALITLFEDLWTRATPVLASTVDDPARLLVSLMRMGLTDDVIAKQLGTSTRTVLRRIRGLMDQTGARTRFQLGCEAVHRGWT